MQNVNGVCRGDPYFLEPFWMEHAESSAILVSGWHRMSYSYDDGSFMSQVLEMQIRKLHETVGNAVTRGKYIVFGAGSTQLFGAALYALSFHNSSSVSPAQVVATVPYFKVYTPPHNFYIHILNHASMCISWTHVKLQSMLIILFFFISPICWCFQHHSHNKQCKFIITKLQN